MQLKKIFTILLVVVLAMATITLGAAAAAADSLTFAVSTSGTANEKGDVVFAPGETFDVTVAVENNPGIVGLDFVLSFDAENFALVEESAGVYDYVPGAFLEENHIADFSKVADGLITIKSYVDITNLVESTDDGAIATFTFEVIATACVDEAAFTVTAAHAMDKNYGSPVVALGSEKVAVHTIDSTDAIPGDCVTPGTSAASGCTECDYVITEATEVPAPGHTPATRPGRGASCTLPAMTDETYCSVCDEILIPSEEIPGVYAHTPTGEWIVDEEATCTTPGSRHKVCADCGEVAVTEVIFATGHDYTIVVTPSTCTELGSTTYTCACGDTYTVEAEALAPHDYVMTEEAATCTKEGTITFACVCGDKYVVKTAMLPHDYAITVVESTCTVLGSTTYTCACGDTYTVAAEALAPHDYAVTVVASTCTKLGSTTYTCACGDTYTVAAEALAPHDYVMTEEAATCTKQGTITFTCACGDKYVVKTALAAHDYKGVDTAPTCMALGYTTYTCKATGCTASYVGNYVAALPHDYAEAVTAPTCTTDGFTTYTCKAEGCTAIYVGDLKAATGHDYDAVVTAPTCTAMGYTTYTCSVCDDKYVGDYVDAKGHTVEKIAAVEPTMGAEGSTEGEKCSVCDTVLNAPDTIAKKSPAWIIVLSVNIVLLAGVVVAAIIMAKKQVWIFKK